MKNNISITYIKDGEEKTINNFFSYKLFIKELFNLSSRNYQEWALLYRTNLFKEYQTLKKEIEFIHIKNGVFTRNVEFYCENPDSIVILEDCVFKCDFIGIENGNYQIINPKFDLIYQNTICSSNCQNVEIKGDKNTAIPYFNANGVDNIKLSTIKNIKALYISSNSKITIDEIQKIDEYNINTNDIEIKNCPKEFNLFQDKIDYYHRFFAYNLILENTNITTNMSSLYYKNIKLKNSNIYYFSDSKKSYLSFQGLDFPILKELTLDNSHISSSTSIRMNEIKKIELDDTSSIKVKEFIEIGNYEYKNEINPTSSFILNKDTLNEVSFLRRNLINYLIEISDIYHSRIMNQLHKQEQEVVYELQKEKDKQIKLIEEISDKKITRAKKKIRNQKDEILSQTKIGDINK